jgi:hypothetical protein
MHFLRGVSQAVRVDVDANAAAGTLHVFTGLQSPNALFKVVAAARALKFDHVGIDVRHQKPFVSRLIPWLAFPRGVSLVLRSAMIQTKIILWDGVLRYAARWQGGRDCLGPIGLCARST